jgi:glutamate/tyrosine decarboxylase-like PLP-dependent enzyme
LRNLAVELQESPLDPAHVLAELDTFGSPATSASAGGRYFGFVIGGTLPAALASHMLSSAWDQNAGLEIISPIAAHLEEICRTWLTSLLTVPATSEIGFVSGATTANLTALAAARHAVLEMHGWDVERRGLFGAPPIAVIVGEEAHISVIKSLGILGLGRERVVRVPADEQGRMRADHLPRIDGPSIVCVQAGNVNTGAIDPIDEIADRVAHPDVWLHVDGAFGLWAAASPRRRALVKGVERAHSHATDAHKWLNVPYDNGIVFVREGRHLNAAMFASAAYLTESETRDPHHSTPELSRRARSVEVWAALRSLGKQGLADLIDRTCDYATRFGTELRAAGYEVLNDIVLNQVLVSFGTSDETRRVIAKIQEDGTCWCSGTEWHGRTAMRISVSSWATTDDDVTMSIEAMLRCACEVTGR